MRTVRDIMRKPRRSLFVTHSLADAAEQIGPDGGGIVVLNLCGRPVGVITDGLLQHWRAAYPENWRISVAPARFRTHQQSSPGKLCWRISR